MDPLYPNLNNNNNNSSSSSTSTSQQNNDLSWAYRRLKSTEEIAREMEDARIAREFASSCDARIENKEDEAFAKRLLVEETMRLNEMKKQKEIQAEKDAEVARRMQKDLQDNEEETKRRLRDEQEAARIRREQEERFSRDKLTQKLRDEQLARQLQQEDEKQSQVDRDIAMARRLDEEERQNQRRRLELERLESERIAREREEQRRRDDERRRQNLIMTDAELARRLDQQLNIYIPPPPPPPVYYNNNNPVNYHTLAIHSEHCGCAKHNVYNANHVNKIHRKYCGCTSHRGPWTNEGLYHNHSVGCRIYCKYTNHVHTSDCCSKNHTHTGRCHCSQVLLIEVT